MQLETEELKDIVREKSTVAIPVVFRGNFRIDEIVASLKEVKNVEFYVYCPNLYDHPKLKTAEEVEDHLHSMHLDTLPYTTVLVVDGDVEEITKICLKHGIDFDVVKSI